MFFFTTSQLFYLRHMPNLPHTKHAPVYIIQPLCLFKFIDQKFAASLCK